MQVLHVVPWYEPAWKTGGTAVAVSGLCRALAEQGVDVTVYTTSDDGEGGTLDVPLDEPVSRGDVTVYYFEPDFFLSSKRSFSATGLLDRLDDHVAEYDLVHVSSTRHRFEKRVADLSAEHGVPYIVTPHGSLMASNMRSIGNAPLKWLYMRLVGDDVLAGASALHFLSESERRASDRYVGETPSFVVPNGIDASQLVSPRDGRDRRLRYGIPNSATVFLYLGRIHPAKNIDLVLAALGRVLDDNDDVFFLVVGPVADDEYYASLLADVEDGLARHARIHPPVEYDRVGEVYDLADVFVLPSDVEGVSMATIEAMSASLPVVASTEVANAADISDTESGRVVEPTVEELSRVIAELASDPATVSRLAENARATATERYDVANVARTMRRAYEDVLAGEQRDGLHWEGDL